MHILFYVPNMLTALRIFVLPFICWMYFSPHMWVRMLGFGLYTLACLTDFFDGFLARHYGIQTPIGRLLDTLADKLLLVVLAVFLVGFGPVRGIDVIGVILLIVREMCMLTLAQYESLKTHRVVSGGRLGKYKAVCQFLFIGFFYVGDEGGRYLLGLPPIAAAIGTGLLWLAVVLSFLSTWQYFHATFSKES